MYLKKKIKSEAKVLIQSELTEALYRGLLISLVTLFLVASIIVWQIYGKDQDENLLVWYLVLCAIIFYRGLLFVWYQHTKSIIQFRAYHYYLFILGSTFSGLLLGILGSFLMPNDIQDQAFILILLCGITAGSVQSLSPSFLANILHVYLIAGPLLVWEMVQIYHKQTIYIGIFFAMLIFCVYSYFFARRGHFMLVKHLELEYNYKSLLQRVSNKKNKYKELATHDLLTGLYNHQFLKDYLEIEIHKAKRNKTNIAVIMLDIDFFKDFNDRYGHLCGDEILQSIGDLLNQNVRKSDIACRYGGEEFMIIMPESSLANVREKAEIIREMVKAVSIKRGSLIVKNITVSLGVSFYPQNGLTRSELIEAADKALYNAKQTGKDRVCMAERPAL